MMCKQIERMELIGQEGWIGDRAMVIVAIDGW